MNAQFLKSMRAALIVLLTTQQAYGAPTCNQLVCADVVKSQKVATNKLCVSGDANFGGDVTIDGDLVVSGSIVNTISPIEGWWLNTTKSSTVNTSVLWHIYHNGNELRAHLYAGYQGRYREWTPEDFQANQVFFVNKDGIPTNDFPLLERAPGSYIVNPLEPASPEYFSPQQNNYWLNVSETNPDILYFRSLNRLARLAQAPEIETFDNPAYIDNTNPVSIFESIFNTAWLIGNPQFAVDIQPSDYPGFAAFTAHKNKLLSTGVSYETLVKDVWITRLDAPTGVPFPLSTTLVTLNDIGSRVGGRLIIEGFLPPYDILNNSYAGNPESWEIGIADSSNGRNAAQVYGAQYYDAANQKTILTFIDPDPVQNRADSSSITEPYDPIIHGVAQITLIVDPVTPTSNYKTLVAAIQDLYSFADRSTHSYLFYFIDSNFYRVYSTIEEIQAGLNDGTIVQNFLTSRGYYGTRATSNYVDIDFHNFVAFNPIPSNDPTGISLYDGDSPTAFYSIDIFNYLNPELTFNIYWGLTGAPIPGSPITTEKLVDATGGYYKTPGSEFVFTVDNYYNNYIYNNTPPDPAFWSLYSVGNYNDFNNLVFGILDESKTCGETIAYISFLDCTGIDPIYNASTFPEFTSNNGAGPIGPLTDCFALMMETLNQFNPTTYIINFRGNLGGDPLFYITIPAFFGQNRPGYERSVSFADNGNRPGITLQEIQDDGNLNLQSTIDSTKVIDTDLFASLYPNAIVRTPGTKVFFITDANAESAGDATTHYIRNNDAANPGNLGGGVSSFIVGDVDGRLFTGASKDLFLFTNMSNNIMVNDMPVSEVIMHLEAGTTNSRIGENPYPLTNQNPVIAPDLLFNMDIENTFWLDVGSKGTYPLNPIDGGTDPLVLPLSAGVTQPVYANDVVAQATWRDRVLEACIMMAVPEGCFEEPLRTAQQETKAQAHKGQLAKHLAKRPVQKPDPKRERLSLR